MCAPLLTTRFSPVCAGSWTYFATLHDYCVQSCILNDTSSVPRDRAIYIVRENKSRMKKWKRKELSPRQLRGIKSRAKKLSRASPPLLLRSSSKFSAGWRDRMKFPYGHRTDGLTSGTHTCSRVALLSSLEFLKRIIPRSTPSVTPGDWRGPPSRKLFLRRRVATIGTRNLRNDAIEIFNEPRGAREGGARSISVSTSAQYRSHRTIDPPQAEFRFEIVAFPSEIDTFYYGNNGVRVEPVTQGNMELENVVGRAIKIWLRIFGIWPSASGAFSRRLFWIVALMAEQIFQYRYVVVHFHSLSVSDMMNIFSEITTHAILLIKLGIFWCKQR